MKPTTALQVILFCSVVINAGETKKEVRMEPRLVTYSAFELIGKKAYRDYSKESNEGALWDALIRNMDTLKDIASDEAFYGANIILSGDSTKQDIFDYLAGMKVTKEGSPKPAEFSTIRIPELLYAEFSFKFKNMGESIKFASRNWLPKSEYIRDKKSPIYDFVKFPGKTTGESICTFAIPVKGKTAK